MQMQEANQKPTFMSGRSASHERTGTCQVSLLSEAKGPAEGAVEVSMSLPIKGRGSWIHIKSFL